MTAHLHQDRYCEQTDSPDNSTVTVTVTQGALGTRPVSVLARPDPHSTHVHMSTILSTTADPAARLCHEKADHYVDWHPSEVD